MGELDPLALTLAIWGARSASSFSSRSRRPAKPAVPPVSTTLLYRSLRTSTSHLEGEGCGAEGGPQAQAG